MEPVIAGRDLRKILGRHGGDVIALNGAETQAFLRLLRWAEANGRVERIET